MSVGTFFVPHDLAAPLAGADNGPLAGLTVAVKDMYDIAGTTTGGGNPDWLAAHAPATSHAPAVARLLAAGATIIGKTICDEFFFSVTGANAHYGTPPNVRAPGRLPGGSSSGSAAATAAGVCDIALGSDTGGSVRAPASFCGLYGIRPTHGRVDLTGAMAMAESFDVAGWFAASPGVFRKVGRVLLDDARVDAAVAAMVVLDDAFEQADDAVAVMIRSALGAMADELPKPSSARIAPDGLDAWFDCFRIIQARETWQVYGSFIEAKRPRLGPGIKERMEFAATVSQRDAEIARAHRARLRDVIRDVARPGTILVLPTVPSIAPRVDASADELNVFRPRVMRMTCIAGLGGLPQVTLPVGTVSGCPAGLSVIGWAGGDEVLLDLAVRLSKHCGREARGNDRHDA